MANADTQSKRSSALHYPLIVTPPNTDFDGIVSKADRIQVMGWYSGLSAFIAIGLPPWQPTLVETLYFGIENP